jgi:glutamyl-tRNA synthetase
LFNWLFARQHGGTFILRIEDTDAERNREEWVEGIQTAMRWLGVEWDEGPYRQSERATLYAQAAEKLFADGRAYYCDCTREMVEARRPEGAPPGYDGFCRDRNLGPGEGRALRFRVPDDGATTVVDVIRGNPTFEHRTIEDFVVVRSSGAAMFLLANVVDDIDMRISHVIRGEEHLPNTPKALLLWDALGGGAAPVFAHLPVLVNEKRQKLSKRRDPVALEGYRDQGFLPEGMRNYLALLGWSPADGRDFLTVDDLLADWRLAEVGNSPAFFDVVKLTHINGLHIRALSVDDFIERCRPWTHERAPWPPENFDPGVFASVAPLVQERVDRLDKVPEHVDFLFLDEPEIDATAWAKATRKGDPAAVLDDVIAGCETIEWAADAIEAVVRDAAERHGLKVKDAQAPVRVAVTGRSVGPPLWESMALLGRDRALHRLRAARDRL